MGFEKPLCKAWDVKAMDVGALHSCKSPTSIEFPTRENKKIDISMEDFN
jgi:hypothetical protein